MLLSKLSLDITAHTRAFWAQKKRPAPRYVHPPKTPRGFLGNVPPLSPSHPHPASPPPRSPSLLNPPLRRFSLSGRLREDSSFLGTTPAILDLYSRPNCQYRSNGAGPVAVCRQLQ